MTPAQEQTIAAEAEWLERWSTGPTEPAGEPLRTDAAAPDLVLLDHTGRQRTLSEFWADGPALLMFWRHFGCGCGFERARRLDAEIADYQAAGLAPRDHRTGRTGPCRRVPRRTPPSLRDPVRPRSRCLPRLRHRPLEHRASPTGRSVGLLGSSPAGWRRFPDGAPPARPTARRRPVARGQRVRRRDERSRPPRVHVSVLRGLSRSATADHRRADQPGAGQRSMNRGRVRRHVDNGGVVPDAVATAVIATGHLVLRPTVVSDAAEMVGILADPALYEFIGGEPPSLADLERRYQRQLDGPAGPGETWHNWIVRSAVNGCAVGFVQATVHSGRGDARLAHRRQLPGPPLRQRGGARGHRLVGSTRRRPGRADRAHPSRPLRFTGRGLPCRTGPQRRIRPQR